MTQNHSQRETVVTRQQWRWYVRTRVCV